MSRIEYETNTYLDELNKRFIDDDKYQALQDKLKQDYPILSSEFIGFSFPQDEHFIFNVIMNALGKKQYYDEMSALFAKLPFPLVQEFLEDYALDEGWEAMRERWMRPMFPQTKKVK